MVGNMVTTWQERMLDCTGMPRNVIAPAETINVAVIDRHYSAGRSFLNLPDVISHLQVGFFSQPAMYDSVRWCAHHGMHETMHVFAHKSAGHVCGGLHRLTSLFHLLRMLDVSHS